MQNNPIARAELPRSLADISNRSNEIAFNISFVREISSLYYSQQLPEEERSARVTHNPTRLHLISGLDQLVNSGISSKFNSEPGFLEKLHGHGVAAADAWLREHGGSVGLRTTLDPAMVFAADLAA